MRDLRGYQWEQSKVPWQGICVEIGTEIIFADFLCEFSYVAFL